MVKAGDPVRVIKPWHLIVPLGPHGVVDQVDGNWFMVLRYPEVERVLGGPYTQFSVTHIGDFIEIGEEIGPW